jgi:DnaJ-domain-containing protein 1
MKDCPNCGSQNKVDAVKCYVCRHYFDDESTSDFNDSYEEEKRKNKNTLFDCPVCKNNFKINTNDDFNAFACKNCRSIFSYEWKNNKLIISAVKKQKYIPDEIRKAANIFELEFPISEEDLKKSYHKILAQYHPDKVAHLAKEFIDLSEQKTKEIIKNYELLKSWVENNK